MAQPYRFGDGSPAHAVSGGVADRVVAFGAGFGVASGGSREASCGVHRRLEYWTRGV